jgi:lysyl-tRNA synthetase class 2
MSSPPEFRPTASLDALRRRAALLDAVRTFFAERGYFEVETPLLSRDCCIDAWLDPFAVPLHERETAWLQTSPEFAMKRLLCAGAQRIFQIGKSFRRDEVGARHNPEFTLLEWYETGSDHHAQMSLTEDLVRRALASPAADPALASRFGAPFIRLSYEQAFRDFAGLSPSQAPLPELLDRARSVLGRDIAAEGADRDDVLNVLLAGCVEPRLAELGAAFLYDYPASQAALAKTHAGPPAAAERFELYLDGMEICNGYHELTDAAELRRRMQRQNTKRLSAGKPALPVESRLLAAMEAGLPACAGVALGFDRLAMRALGLPRLADVIAFPFDRA